MLRFSTFASESFTAAFLLVNFPFSAKEAFRVALSKLAGEIAGLKLYAIPVRYFGDVS